MAKLNFQQPFPCHMIIAEIILISTESGFSRNIIIISFDNSGNIFSGRILWRLESWEEQCLFEILFL